MSSEAGMFLGGYMWIFWLLVIAAIVSVIISALSISARNRSASEDSPLDILKRRYARGEIDDEEFKRRRNELEQ